MAATGTASDWLSRTWSGKRAQFENILAKIPGYATQLALSGGDVTAIQKLCEEAIAVIDFQTQAQAWAQGLTQWRDLAFTGTPKGGAFSDPAAALTYSPVAPSVIGILAILRDWRDKWLAADGYTPAIGEDLMVVKPDSGPDDPSGVTALIAVSPAQSGYMAGVTVTDRGESDMWIVETRQAGGQWQNAGSFTGKTADVTITPTNPGQPEIVEFRIRLRKGNQDYGNLSQTATVTVNP